ncbi:MAG TPA: ABC transporter substrate-binding protein [Burkholderiales bacterium]|nr:ABC transporter substrate-binding protein [Burkholderiales bacterium]
MKPALLLAVVVLAGCVTPDVVSQETVRDLAPTGALRAAINFGNPVLAQKSASGEAGGVSVDLARELARRLGVPVELRAYDAAGKVFADAKTGAWDIAFIARDPQRANEVEFTAPYVIIEGTYLVPEASPLRTVQDVDRDGLRVAVGRGSVYDLYLTRTLKHAQLVRAPTSPEAPELFLRDKLDAAAGIRQQLVQAARQHPGLRVMPDRFMVIEQAMAVPRGRPLAARYLREFVDEMKASGFVAASLQKSGQSEAAVAP